MKLTTSAIVLLSMMGIAIAAKAGNHHEGFKAAKQECRQSLGLEKGSKKTDVEREKMRACLTEKGFDRAKFKAFKSARKECKQGLGLERGQRPTDDQRTKIRSCLEAKGYKRPDKSQGGQV